MISVLMGGIFLAEVVMIPTVCVLSLCDAISFTAERSLFKYQRVKGSESGSPVAF